MKIIMFIILQMCISIFVEAKGSSNHHHWKTRSYKVQFPSGKSYTIIPPKAGSMSDCPGKATFVKLSSKRNKWKSEYQIVRKELERMLSAPAIHPFPLLSWLGIDFSTTTSGFQGFQYLKIEKVFNPCLSYEYKYRKNLIHNEVKDVHEKMLFHASPAPYEVANSGFDERYSSVKPNGALGAGLYFFDDPLEAHQSTKRRKGKWVMMLCRVTLGKTNYTASMVAHAPVGFHSVGSKHQSYTEYSIYRGEQAYPDYIISYIPV